MADERKGTFAMPALKRQKLDQVSPSDPSGLPFERHPSSGNRRDSLDSPTTIFEVSPSSSDPQNDDSGGDSGFHEILPPNKANLQTSSVQINNSTISSSSSSSSNIITKNNFTQPKRLAEVLDDDSDKTCEPKTFSNCFESMKNSCSRSHSFSPSTANNDNSVNNHEDAEGDADDVASTISDISGLSDFSDLSGHEWKPIAGPVSWVQQQINTGADPRAVLGQLVPNGTLVPDHIDEITLWKIIVNILSEPPRRSKLNSVNTLDDVVGLINSSRNIIVLTGAGVSVSSGIPDFRSRNGIYARLSKDFPDLPDPQAMFDIHYFRKDPRPFFKFAKEIYPGQFEPSVSHRFIKLLEDKNKLLRNYSQNIDTLEKAAGIERVIACHGSFATASCTRCRHKVDCSDIREEIFTQRIPACRKCSPSTEAAEDGDDDEDDDKSGVMKPDIVFFGEGLSDEFHRTMGQDKDKCDLLIVMGSSLKVRPVALIPSSIPADIPQILINREPLKHLNFDVELLGDCDVIIQEICRRLSSDWSQIGCSQSLHEVSHVSPLTSNSSSPSSSSSSMDDEDEGLSCSSHRKVNGELPWTDKSSLASKLPEASFLFVPPSRYIFPGAEVFAEESANCSFDCDDDEEESSSNHVEPVNNQVSQITIETEDCDKTLGD